MALGRLVAVTRFTAIHIAPPYRALNRGFGMAISARLDELKRKFDENPRRYFAPLANEYRKQGDTTQAIALCRTHLPNQPGHISGHIVLAQALYESRELVESRQIFEAALELDPENIIALRYLGDIAREQGSPSAAQAWYKRVLEFDPRNEEIAQLLADVKPEAEAELAELASRPTPAITEATAVQPDVDGPHDEPIAPAEAPEVASVEDVEPVAVERTETLELETMELAPPPAAASTGYDVTDHVLLDAPAEALEMMEEPLDLYDADPTGDSWRESIAEEAGDARPSGQAADLSFTEQLPAESETPPAAEPSFDDWFAQPASPEAAATHEVAFEEFAPDLTAATPAAPEAEAAGPGAAADAIEEFSWSLTEAEAATQPMASEPEAPVEGGATEEPEMEFTSWGAAEAEPSAPAAPASAEAAGDESPWIQPHPSIEDSEAEPAGHASVPDESVAGAWTDADGLASAREDDIEAAFDTEDAYEEAASAAESPYGFSDARDDSPAGVSADTDAGDVLPGIDSLSAGVDEEAEAEDAIAASMASSDPLIGRTPSFVPAVSEESSAAFVTETMAELYLQQGFHDEALSIYRQLLARNPQDRTLAERVQALEEGGASAVIDESRPAAHPRPDSESARAFFARFASRTPSRGGGEGNADDRRGESAQAATVPLGGAAMPDEALTRPDEPTLTHMFSDRQVPSGDAQAARTLASAFGATPDVPPAPGGELSLQQLFRDVPARSSGAVTLGEQGTDASQGSAGSSGAPDPEVEAPADYEQFTAWLEGLKKK